MRSRSAAAAASAVGERPLGRSEREHASAEHLEQRAALGVDAAAEHDAGDARPRTGARDRRDGLAARALSVDRALGGQAEAGAAAARRRARRCAATASAPDSPEAPSQYSAAPSPPAAPAPGRSAISAPRRAPSRASAASITGTSAGAQPLLRPEQPRGAVRAGERHVDVVQRDELDRPRAADRARRAAGSGSSSSERPVCVVGQRAERAEQAEPAVDGDGAAERDQDTRGRRDRARRAARSPTPALVARAGRARRRASRAWPTASAASTRNEPSPEAVRAGPRRRARADRGR